MKHRIDKILFILFVFILYSVPLHAQTTKTLRQDIETVYRNYCKAILTDDDNLLRNIMASPAYIELRNGIISYKQSFPEYFFKLKKLASPTDISKLIFLTVKIKGSTANAIYFGEMDMGTFDNPKKGKGFLILQFIKEGERWRFDAEGIVSAHSYPDVEKSIQGNNLGFLNSKEFLPSGIVPPTLKPCSFPDYIAQLNVRSEGYSTTVNINGYNYYGASSFLIFGGLRKGDNIIEIISSPDAKATLKKLVVTIDAKPDVNAGDFKEVFKYAPVNVPNKYTYTLVITENAFSNRKVK